MGTQIKEVIANLEKRGRTFACVQTNVANPSLHEQNESRLRELKNCLSVQKAVHEKAQQTLTFKELVRH